MGKLFDLKVDKFFMPTVNSHSPANLFVATPSLSVNTIEGGKFDLNPGQMLRAIVISRELDQVVLEVDRQLYLAKGERELQVGQKVDLQVVQTQPGLEFKVLSHPYSDRLSQSLPLLTRPFDWSQLIVQLQKPSLSGLESAVPERIYSQLQQVLGSAPATPAQLGEQIANIVNQLQRLAATEETVLGGHLSPVQALPLQEVQNIHQRVPFELSQTVMRLIKNLQNQLSSLPKEGEAMLPKSWYAETRNLLSPLQQSPQLPLQMSSQRQLLVTILNQIRQHPKVSPQLSGEIKLILVQIDRQVAQDVTITSMKGDQGIPPSPATIPGLKGGETVMSLSIEIKQLLAQVQQGHENRQGIAPELRGRLEGLLGQIQQLPYSASVSFPGFEVQVNQLQELLAQQHGISQREGLSVEIKELLAQVQQGQENKQGIAPELLGRLEGLLGRLQHLPHAASVLLPDFQMMMNQLEQLVAQRPNLPQGGQLGVLSQLFGFHLESELLQGKKKDALHSLKLSLLNLQKDLGEEVKEPLRRIELFQLCKAKLAEEQVAFLPLPFKELEEGYLLAERQSHGDDGNVEGESPLQMSLSLRLSALGNLRVDMLYEKGGLHLRLACEDRAKMHYLQGCADELKESLGALKLQGVSFSADARLPARQLKERLLPDSFNMLDERL